MMIDGVNILNDYGAVISVDSYKDIVSYPSLKEPEKNDWAEEQGIEVDLSTPRLNKRNLKLYVICDVSSVNSFIDFLVQKTYRIYVFSEIVATYKLRFLGISNYTVIHNKATFYIELSDDYPLYEYTPEIPLLDATDYQCTIDSVNIKNYGINIVEGTYESLEGFSKVKDRLEINNKVMQGVEVFEAPQVFKEYRGKLKCYMRQSIADFWKGYNGLLNDLIQSGTRTLVANNNSYEFYYKSSKVNSFYVIKGIVFCDFDIEIEVI